MTVRTVHNHETLISPDCLYSAVMIPKNASTSLAKHYKEQGWLAGNGVAGWPFAFIRHPEDRYISQLWQTWSSVQQPLWKEVCSRGWVHDFTDVHMFPQHKFVPDDCTLIPLETVLPLLGYHERSMPDWAREIANTHLGWQSYCQAYADWPQDMELYARAWSTS